MRPANLQTKIFLDGGDPDETKSILNDLGFIDGQTTNPSLVAKNPEANARLEKGDLFTADELLAFYRQVVTEVSKRIPDGSVSIEVYADQNTTAEEMFHQGQEMFGWIPNAHIKYPLTSAGLEAAEKSVKNGLRVNMTLCFTLEQAAAVYTATKGAKPGDVFVSPFVGRLDDQGKNGMDLIKNIIQMYNGGDKHVEVLTASVRNIDHFLYALALKSDIITAPSQVLKEWSDAGAVSPNAEYEYGKKELSDIVYKDIDLNQSWRTYNIQHELTDAGIEKFAVDWNKLLKK